MAVSLVVIGYGTISNETNNKELDIKLSEFQKESDSATVALYRDSVNTIKISRLLKNNASQYNYLDSSLKTKNLTLKSRKILEERMSLNIAEFFHNDSLSTVFNETFFITKVLVLASGKRLNNASENYHNLHWIYFFATCFGLSLFGLALVGLLRIEQRDRNLLLLENYKKGRVSLWCQSCGRNFSGKRLQGKNADSTTNYSFCESCYSNGTYTDPLLNRQRIWLRFVRQIRRATTKKEKKRIRNRFRSLERWNYNNEYWDVRL